MKNFTKYIFITGGVLSSLGKGITSSSIGNLLKNSNLNVGMLKIDPYINIDPGTMSPLEHGEVFVTKDGAETDLDLGHYERFLDTSLEKKNNFTTGKIYERVIKNERNGLYLGKTIQIIPHITDEIKRRIILAGKNKDILIIELGGTVGDIEGLPFLETIRQIKHEYGFSRVMNIHVTLLPYINVTNELKTKPTQHSVQELRRIGISPNMIILRAEKTISYDLKKKISYSCNLEIRSIIEATDSLTIYQVPVSFMNQNILNPIYQQLNISYRKTNIKIWNTLVDKILHPKKQIKIAFICKYFGLKESYKSLIESFIHCGAHLDVKINIEWIDSEKINSNNIEKYLSGCSAVLIPGGFGQRGIYGKIEAIKHARENNIITLGICLGMQLMIIEIAQNLLNIKDANSTEFDKDTKHPFIDFINKRDNQNLDNIKIGGTLRLGEYSCDIKDGSKLKKAYNNQDCIYERHRHRYEFNSKYIIELEKIGLIVSGKHNNLVEAIELKNHNWFIGVQFHPEFSSSLEHPNLLLLNFVKSAISN